jgi:F-type H+/Na+-transporting ATPase subunit alpha
MKKVSGTLKLDLAQYRELAAFSQFSSDLDSATKAQLDRGARMMELIKQGTFSPVPVEKQVCAFYAGAKGFIDPIAKEKVKKFEEDLYVALDEEKTILEAIRNEKAMSDETEVKLKEVIGRVVELNK